MSVDAFVLASDLLTRVVAALSDLGNDLPDSQYVTAGDSRTIAYDGPSVMVNLDAIRSGQPGSDDSTRFPGNYGLNFRYAQFAVTILRWAATMQEDGRPPELDDLVADAERSMMDCSTLHLALEQIRNDCATGQGWVGPQIPIIVGPVTPVGPAGGAVAAVGTISVGML